MRVVFGEILGGIWGNVFRSFNVDFAVSVEINLVWVHSSKPTVSLVFTTPLGFSRLIFQKVQKI